MEAQAAAAARVGALQRALAAAPATHGALARGEAARRALASGDFELAAFRRHARGDVEETTVVVRKTQPGQQQGQQQGQQRVQHMQMQGQPRGLAWDAASGQVDRCEVVDSDLEHRQMILDAFS